MSNENRAHHAHAALAHHARISKCDGPDIDPHSAIQVMLTNLRHWCDAHGEDFEQAVEMSNHHYKAEAA